MDKVLLTGVIGFCSGILWYSFFHSGWYGVIFVLLVTLVCFVFLVWKKGQILLTISVFALGVFLGVLRTELVPHALPRVFIPLLETSVTIEGPVVADPDIRENSQRLTVEIEKGGVRTHTLVIAPVYPSASYGDTVRATGLLVSPEPFDGNNGRTFRYDLFLAKDNVFSMVQDATLEIVAPRTGIWMHIRGALSDFKNNGLRVLAFALPEPQASLAGGLILGGKQGLGKELLNDFITSGLVHIVVLSGYNVMIVADFILRIFGFLSKGWASGAAIFTIIAFVLSAGAGAASIRAGIMASIALYGRASGRTYDALRALLFAGVLMLLIQPLTLAFDPGFQLSFIATLGLIFGAPITERWFAFVQLKFLREIASATVAAQISVLPLLLYQNGLFSFVALPANLLVLPVVPVAMLFSGFAGLAGLLIPSLAPLIGLPAYLLLSYITGVVEISANLPFAAISLPSFSYIFVVIAYVLLGIFVTRLHVRQTVSHTHSN